MSYSDEQFQAAVTTIREAAKSLGEHDLALGALLTVYAQTAQANPCCIQQCGNHCFQLSMLLARLAAEQRPTPGTPVH